MASENWVHFPGVPNMTQDADGRPQVQDLVPGKQEGTPLEALFFNPLLRKVCDLQDGLDEQQSGMSQYAANDALQKEVQRAQEAEEKLQPAGDYATNPALQQEVQRAEAAEAALLPLAGGTVTGTITRSAGGVLPEVLGMGGRAVIQAFTAQGNGPGGNGDVYIQFPVAFAANSTPIVSVTINREPGGRSRFAAFGNYNSANSPWISNTGFWVQPTWASSEGAGTTGQPWVCHIIAIGTL